MRRLICLLLAAVMATMLTFNIQAAEKDTQEDNVIYLENGDYIVVKVIEQINRSINGKTGTKYHIYYGSDGAAKWQAVLNATFIYTGSSSTCTASSCDVTIYDSNYYLISKNASRSGNAAYGTATVGRKILGITHDQNTINLTLTCDVNGNLS
jgi:hypothetical protein